jgi:hypothetical protein
MNSELTKELVKLANENPDLPIISSVNFEVIGGDEYTYWVGELSKVFVDYTYLSERQEKWLWGEYDIKEAIFEDEEYEDEDVFDNMSSEEVEKFLDNEFNKLKEQGDIKKCIIMRIDP